MLRTVYKTVLVLVAVAPAAHASKVPDGIYDLVVGGEKNGIAVVENGKFTRPVFAGKCTLEQAEGALTGDTLTVDIPEKCLGHTTLDLRHNQGKLKFQDSNSFYLNTAVTTTDGEKPSLNLASGLFHRQHFAYSDAFLDTRSGLYSRGETRIERDLPGLLSKIVIGDVNTETASSLVPSKRMGGIKFSRNWAQDPDRASTVYYSSSHTLKLSSRSTLEIYRDGQLVDRRELPAGEYDMRNLPAAAYASRLKIIVRDAYGNVREIEADVINPPRLLSAGSFDYSFSVGAERTGFSGFGEYRRATGGGYIGYGLADWISVFAAVSDKAATGTASIATPFGAVSGEARLDSIGDWRAAHSYSWRNLAASAEYRVLDNKHSSNANVSVGLDQFGSVTGRLTSGESQFYEFYGVSYNVSLPWSVSMMTSADFSRTGHVGYSAGITKQWNQRLSTQVTYIKGLDRSDRGFAQLTFALDRAKPAAIGIQTSSTNVDGKTSAQTRTEGRYGIYASVAAHTPPVGKTATTATVAGSIACAEGTCRIGEPVNGGYAVGDGLVASGLSGSVLQLPAYYNTRISASTRTATDTQIVAVRPGQGVRLTLKEKINIQAVLYAAGKPAGNRLIQWEGGETITGEDGLLWLENVRKNGPIRLEMDGEEFLLHPDYDANIGGIVDLGIVAIDSNITALNAHN